MVTAVICSIVIGILVGFFFGVMAGSTENTLQIPQTKFEHSYEWTSNKNRISSLERSMMVVQTDIFRLNCLREEPTSDISKISDEKLLAECNRRKLKTVIQK